MTNRAELLPLPAAPAQASWPMERWTTSDLDPRVDSAQLESMLDHAFAQPTPDDLERTHAVLVVQRGAIVAERYAEDVGPEDTFLSWSMAKSITSALVGILVRQGRLDIKAPMPVPEWSADDPRSKITIDQMLRMVDGLRFREAEDLGNGSIRYYPPEESDVIPMLFGEGQGDVASFASGLPKVAEPETRWNYNSGGSNLLARLVGQTVGGGREGMERFMKQELFAPIGFKSADPRFDDMDTFVGASHFFANARDYARFGLLYLRDGCWDGHRILPPGWVDYSRTPGQLSGGLYGAHFWTIPGSLGLFYCSGAQGQRILLSPKLDLIVVRLGKTPPHKVDAVVRYCKEIVDLFRATAE